MIYLGYQPFFFASTRKKTKKKTKKRPQKHKELYIEDTRPPTLCDFERPTKDQEEEEEEEEEEDREEEEGFVPP